MQKKSKKLISPVFLKAIFCSLLGLFFYIIGKKVIPFPEKWMGSEENNRSLFFLGIFSHLTSSWVLNYFFMVFDQKKHGAEKIKNWKNWSSKILNLLLFVSSGLISYWEYLSNSLGKIVFLVLILALVDCLLDILIQWMNKQGVCNGFSLLLFVEFLPSKWIAETLWPNLKNNWQSSQWIGKEGLIREAWFCLFLLLTISTFFIWIINIKWEAPVESSNTYFADNPLIKKYRSKMGFRMNFNFMPLYQLSQFLGWTYIGIKLIKTPLVGEGSWFMRTIGEINKINGDLNQKSMSWIWSGESAWESFFLLNNKKRLFGDLGRWLRDWRWPIFWALLALILLRWLVVWFYTRKLTHKTKEISDELKKRGIYINHLSPGKFTRNLLKKVINRLVFYWICVVLIFNIMFDQIFARLEDKKIKEFQMGRVTPPFFNGFLDWFGSVGIGIDLYRQIHTKYKYTKER